jgi:hypothetical protein
MGWEKKKKKKKKTPFSLMSLINSCITRITVIAQLPAEATASVASCWQ